MRPDEDKFLENQQTLGKSPDHQVNLSSFDKHSDQEVWDMFKKGNELAFTYIYSNNINRLYNFGCQFTSNKEFVKDNIQDLFIRLRVSKKRIEVQTIKSYLYKCLYRQLIKNLQKEKITSQITGKEELFQITASSEEKLINTQLDSSRKDALNKALNGLNVKQRQAILLYYYEGISYMEITDIFKLKNVKSARKLIYRAIDKIRDSEWFRNAEFLFLMLLTHLA